MTMVRRRKLTPKRVHQIRRDAATGKVSYDDIGSHFGISGQQVGRIVRREAWRGIPARFDERRAPQQCPVCQLGLGPLVRRLGPYAAAQHVRQCAQRKASR